METAPAFAAAEPSAWFLAFYRESSAPWLNHLPVRFRHVSAFGYMPGFHAWALYDVNLGGTTLRLVSHETAKAWIGKLIEGAVVVRIEPPRRDMPLWSRLGFYCVPAMKHLIGLPCVSLTPGQFYRAVIRNGGTVVSGCESAPASGRPDSSPASATGAD